MAVSNRFITFFKVAGMLALVVGLAAPAPAATVTDLYDFADGPGGEGPFGLIQGRDGALYGPATHGGANDSGVIYRITFSGTETPLYAFTAPDSSGKNADGANPSGNLVQTADGTLYGTTANGGASGYGTVFQLTTAGTLTTLHSFDSTDGEHPFSGLMQASDGNLYGVTGSGGASGYGTVFQITLSGTLTTLHSFNGSDGANAGGLMQAADGALYGTTNSGGASNNGTIYRISTSGALTTLYSFTGGTDGKTPSGPLLQVAGGYLYGVTLFGGANNDGTVFRITTAGVLTTLYSFTGGSDESIPIGGLILCADGNIYGTTHGNGSSTHGTVFQMTTAGALTTLYQFLGSDGDKIYTGLVQGDDGNLYGTTAYGGDDNYGVVFGVTGVYPQPLLNRILPAIVDAGGPAFTLTVRGAGFQTFSTLLWNGAALTTDYVSPTQLRATVPAGLIAHPGRVRITVVTDAGGGTSNARTLSVLQTTLQLTAVHLTRNATTGVYTVNVTVQNVGHLAANAARVSASRLGAAATSTSLPLALGDIPAGGSANAALSYPASAGTPGSVVHLSIAGAFAGGGFRYTIAVALP